MDLANALRLFGRIVETGSMSAAARDLGVAQPAASKLLRRLENHCGARLLERSPRGMRPTAQGRRLHDLSGGALSEIDAAIEAVQQASGAIAGPLTLHAPFCLGERHLHRIASAFCEAHQAVSIDLRLGNSGIDLQRETVDLAFGHAPATGRSVIERKIGVARRILVASPDYVARTRPILGCDDLRDHDLVVTDASLSPGGKLELIGPNGSVTVGVTPAMKTNSVQVLVETLAAGRGVGTAQVLLVSDEIKAGRLVRVLPDHEIAPTDIRLSYRSARLLRPVVRAFVDFAVPAIRRIEGVG